MTTKILKTDKKGQAIIELAVFGTLILFMFGMLVSYMQRMNEQQYAQMEAFRRALYKACTFVGASDDGAGASVQYTVMQNRRLADVSENYAKGSPITVKGSSSVFWAIPKTGEQSDNIVMFKVNDDESPNLHSESSDSGVEHINSVVVTEFTESSQKQENPVYIETIRQSQLKDTIETTMTDKDDNTLWSIKQGVYRDSDGQIRYSSGAVDNQVYSSKTWKTDF